MTRPVVVGIDDIDHSAHAVGAAACEARVRRAPLWLAHAYHWASGTPAAPGSGWAAWATPCCTTRTARW